MIRSCGGFAPAIFRHVANRSKLMHISPFLVPAGITPGHLAMNGTRNPPSKHNSFLPRV